MAHSSQIEDEVDALYDLRPGEFVGARDALARTVRRSGDRAEAERIKALQRPSAAAWAVNQLARREPEWTQALTTAGRRMTEAHEALLAHGDRDAWRDASAEARETVDRLLKLAEGLLRAERGSVSGPLREQVRDTLQAAVTDPEARELVAAGRLSKELRPPSGMPSSSGRFARPSGTGPRGTSRTRPSTGGRGAADPHADGAAALREARAARRAEERDARATLRRTEREKASAQVVAERADQALLRAEKAREAAAQLLAEAEAADQARAHDLHRAIQAQDDAHRQLEAREAAANEAREAVDAFGPEPDEDART
jgi:hypothetical protein